MCEPATEDIRQEAEEMRMVEDQGEEGAAETKMGKGGRGARRESKQNAGTKNREEGGRANDHRGEREKEEKREGLRTEAGRVRTRRRLSPGDKRVSPERREIKGCPLKGFAPAGWGTPGRRRPRPRLREEG